MVALVVRSVSVLACVVACACLTVNVTGDDDEFDDYSSEDDFFNFTDIPFDSAFTSYAPKLFDVQSEGNKTNSTDDQDIEGSQRVVSPVTYSYSTTTEPRTYNGRKESIASVVHYQPPNPLPTKPRPYVKSRSYQTPSASHTIVPMLHYALAAPPRTTVEIEKQRIEKQRDREEPLKKAEENDDDDGGGGEVEEEDDEEEEVEENRSEDPEARASNNPEEEEEGDEEEEEEHEYQPQNADGKVEPSDVVEKKQDPKQQMIEFLEEYGTTEEEEGPEKEDALNMKREPITKLQSRTLKRPKKHQKVEDGLDKILLAPVKFAYSEDSSPSASGHKKHHEGKVEKGGGEAHHADHHSTHGKKGEKGYKGYHKYDKGQKGHHDKESHEKKFSDHKGKKAKKKDSGGHYGAHHKEHKGKKGALYGEKGEHKKGHSTKGEHKIHKKDEYVKKHEFYDEHHEGGEHEKHGGYHEKHGKKHGGKYKKGHKKAGYHDDHHGKKGHHQKGGHHDEHKGHKDAEGHDEHHAHKEKYGKKEAEKKGKKWGFEKKER